MCCDLKRTCIRDYVCAGCLDLGPKRICVKDIAKKKRRLKIKKK